MECYKKFMFACHGTLGHGNWVEIPKCALAAIRKSFNDETFMAYLPRLVRTWLMCILMIGME